MTAEIINLRRARKARARAERTRRAEANRLAHGLSKAERKKAESEQRLAADRHEAHRLAEGGSKPDEETR
jgi:hypothetical protein